MTFHSDMSLILKEKECYRCGAGKPLTDFYKHPSMTDGRINKCKKCCVSEAKNNRDMNIERYKEYDRIRGALPHRKEADAQYHQTEAGKAVQQKARKKWIAGNLPKRLASVALCNAVRDGRVRKAEECSECGEKVRLHGHHDDYSMPLTVRWLCAYCHRAWHREHGEGLNG